LYRRTLVRQEGYHLYHHTYQQLKNLDQHIPVDMLYLTPLKLNMPAVPKLNSAAAIPLSTPLRLMISDELPRTSRDVNGHVSTSEIQHYQQQRHFEQALAEASTQMSRL